MSGMQGKVVLVTGGTAGLGLELAAAWSRAGAQVAIVGRDPPRLDQAVQTLRRRGAEVTPLAADVTQDDSTARMFDQFRQQFRRLDVLVNNVGRSTRGLAAETTLEQYRDLLEVNFLSAVRCTRGALPMLQDAQGHLVFIGSLASKAAGPYLGAYPPSKFAVAAYAQQLRCELAAQRVHVLLVCPGPIARADAGQRYDEQSIGLPESARQPGGGVGLAAISPEKLAARIVLACERREPEIVWPWKARLLFAISQLSPSLGDWFLRRKMK